MSQSKITQISKKLSTILRHRAVQLGLHVRSDGYVSLTSLLDLEMFRSLHVTVEDIHAVVESSDKQRFSLHVDESSGEIFIRANQGHTIENVLNYDEMMERIDKDQANSGQFPTVVHGTYSRFWPSIKRAGLSRMQREHIHFAKGLYSDANVKSGMRYNCDVYIYIDLPKAIADGFVFYQSENGVILTAGNEQGYLPPAYFSKVVDRNGNNL